MQYEIPYKAGDKVQVLTEDGEWVNATIINVAFTSYLSYNNCEFVLKITYLPEGDEKDFNWCEIVGQEEVAKRIKKEST